MAINYLELPITGTDYYSEYFIDLSGTTYKLRFMYNGRAGRWFMSIYSSEDVLLKANLKLRVNQLMLGRFQYDDRLPSGDFMLVNLYSEYEEADYDNINTKCKLIYIEGVYD